jgi:hypothetical protein
MRILLFILAIFAVTAGIGTRAQAQNYPWCAQYSGLGGTNCGFTTFAQCMATLAGMGGFCNANTQYVPPAGSRRHAPTGGGERPLASSTRKVGAADSGGPVQS